MFDFWPAGKEKVRPLLETGPGRTQQHQKEECDINNIMKKFAKTGLVSFVAARKAEYMEVPDMDYHQAMNYIKETEAMFMEMPSSLRKRFDNDPGKFLDFVQDENNRDEAGQLGLLKEVPVEEIPALAPEQAPEEPSTVPT